MAEQVQASLDQMVAPLRDLIDREIFTETEVKSIVARRRESEYLLRRRAARKVDFLRYIEIEQKLEELRKLRTEQKRRDHRKSHRSDEEVTKEEQHIGDAHIVQLIHLLFVRAIRKFRSDLSLHLLHVDFCKEQKALTRLGRVYAEALQIFPRQTGLWIESASHDFFGPRRSIRSARILLQRGLRINSKAEDLWIEYFSLELHYAQTLKGRRQILLGEEENKEDDDEDSNEKDDYKIAKIVLKNAIKTIPESIPFRLKLLDTCRRFPKAESLMESIQAPMQRDFSSKPEAWIARALYEAEKQANNGMPSTKIEEEAEKESESHESEDDDNESETNEKKSLRPKKRVKSADGVIAVLEEALEHIEEDEMYLQAFRFAQQYQDELDQNGQSSQEVSKLITKILDTAEERESADFILEVAEYYVALGEDDKALEVLKGHCNATKKKVTAALWIRWASLVEDSQPSDILKRAVDRTPMNEPDYLQVLLQYFGALLLEYENEAVEELPDKKVLTEVFQRILLAAPTSMDVVLEDVTSYPFGVESVVHAYLKYLVHASEREGIASARRIYQAVLFQSSIQVHESNLDHLRAFVEQCISLERKDRNRLRRIYDKVLELFEDTPLEEIYREQRNTMAIYQ